MACIQEYSIQLIYDLINLIAFIDGINDWIEMEFIDFSCGSNIFLHVFLFLLLLQTAQKKTSWHKGIP